MNPMLRLDRVGGLLAAVQTGKPMDKFMPWSADPKESAGVDMATLANLPAGMTVDGVELSTSRKVARKGRGVVESKQKTGGTTLPSKKLTLEQRRERLAKHGK